MRAFSAMWDRLRGFTGQSQRAARRSSRRMASTVLQGRRAVLECLEERALLSIGTSGLDDALLLSGSGQYPTGGLESSAEQLAWERENLIVAQDIRPNALAIERVNAERAAKGLAPLTNVTPVAFGEEIIGATQAAIDAGEAPSVVLGGAPGGDEPLLGSAVDNSTMKYFPPIGTQRHGDCGAWASTYYAATYTTAFARDLDVAGTGDEYILSPRWTYSFANAGEDGGTYLPDCYQVLLDYGAPSWADFTYTSNPNDPADYLAWVYDDPSIWRDAIGNRIRTMGYVGSLDTSAGLDNLKAMLTNGYVFNYHTNIYDWQWTTISDDASTTADNAYVGVDVAHWSSSLGYASGHFMTIVGYNDDIWVDLNGNRTVDSGEKGALRIANSWGTDWRDDGFTWIAYDALRATSAVTGGPTSTARTQILSGAGAYWMQARETYTPTLLAQFTVAHAKRDQLEMSVGIADGITATQPTSTWVPLEDLYMTQISGIGVGGPYGFDGKDYSSNPTAAPSGTFVIDLTDLMDLSDPDVDPVGNNTYFLGLNDTMDPSLSGTVTAFSLTNAQGDELAVCPTGTAAGNVPKTDSSGSASVAYAFVHVPPSPNTTITGTVWSDENNNGFHDFNEGGLEGWQIYADVNNNGVYNNGEATATTDANGVYSLSVLAGTYTIREVVQSGWLPTAPATGSRVVTGEGGRIVRGNDFGNLETATISGTVWNDRDADGTRDPGDVGLPGWTVFIDDDFDGVVDDGEKSMITDGNGNYSFTSLLPGAYWVRVLLQAGWERTNPISGLDLAVLSAGETYTTDFGNNLPSGVSGTVWEDANGNGQRDAGEPALGGWWIYLDTNNNQQWDADEPWDVSDYSWSETPGVYIIKNPGVPDGAYYVREELQPKWALKSPAVGYYLVTIAAGIANTDRDFVNQQLPGTVTGRVWEDSNDNQTYDDGERLISNCRVYVDRDNDNEWDDPGEWSDLTDANGVYTITEVYPGSYAVREDRLTDEGPPRVNYAVNSPTSGYHTVVVPADETVSDIDFGNRKAATITGLVWNDRDGDEQSVGEPGIAGWTVYWDANGNDSFDVGETWTRTDGTGHYELVVLTPLDGTIDVTVREVLQSGWMRSCPTLPDEFTVTVSACDTVSDLDFGNYEPGTFTGLVWYDEDANGERDATEPGLSGWQVYVDEDDSGDWQPEEPFAITDSNGNYSLDCLAGTYTIRHIVKDRYITTTPADGRHTVTLTAAETNSEPVDFGDVLAGYIHGTVWNDLNGDGIRSANEGALADWTVYLDADNNGALDDGELRTVSTASGAYSFTVVPGTYVVREYLDLEKHPGWVQAWPNALNDYAYTVTVARSQTLTGADFGNVKPGSISGTLWDDKDGNRERNGEEPGLEGWIVYVDLDHDGLRDSSEPQAVTGKDGDYTITGVIAGTRTVREVLKRNWRQTYPASSSASVTVTAGEKTSGVNFGNRLFGAITGMVWNDVDEDGKVDSGESGLADWQVVLHDISNGADDRFTSTDAYGYYSFGDLPAGDYTVWAEVQAGWWQTTPETWSETEPEGGSYTVTIREDQVQVNEQNFGHHNDAPVITDLAATFISSEDPTKPVTLQFSVSDRETLPEGLGIQVKSSNTQLVPPENLILTQNGSDCTLTITPVDHMNGVTTITVTVVDVWEKNTVEGKIVLTVTAVNDPPSFDLPEPILPALVPKILVEEDAVNEDGSALLEVANWATNLSTGPTNETGQTLDFQVTTDHPEYFSVQPAISVVTALDGTRSGTLTYTPAPDAVGTATVSVWAQDWDAASPDDIAISAVQTFTIDITPVNDPPSFVAGGNQTTKEHSGEQTVTGWATNLSTGPTDETDQTLDFVVTTDHPEYFSVQPAISPEGTLTYTPAPDANGLAKVFVRLHDSGGNADGNVDLSEEQSFTITIDPVNDPPSFDLPEPILPALVPEILVEEDAVNEDGSALLEVANWATNLSAGPTDETGQTLDFLVRTDHSEYFAVQPAISPEGTLTYTPAPDVNGSAEVFVRLHDSGGDAEGGVDLSEEQSFTITILPVNDAPSFVAGINQVTDEDSGEQTVKQWATNLSAGPTNETGQTLDFLVTTDHPEYFSVQPAISVVMAPNQPPTGTLTYTPAPDAFGTATVTVYLQDDGGTANGGVDKSAARTFTITLRPVNDAPSFDKGVDQLVDEDAPKQTVGGWATNLSAGAANEASQTLNFLVSTDHPEYFAVQPAITVFKAPNGTRSGTLTYQLATNAAGAAKVTVQLQDNGGTNNGGQNTSDPQTFTITITGVNDPPSFVKGKDVMVDGDAGLTAIVGWATQIAAGGDDESGQSLTFNVTVSDASLFATLPQIAPATGTLTFEPLAGAAGKATVTVSLSDDVGEESTSAEQTFTITIAAPLGELGMRTLTGLDATTGELWYSLETTRDGYLTAEAVDSAAALELYDEDMQPVATSKLKNGNQRIDFPVDGGGETYYLSLSGGGDAVELRVLNLVQVGSAGEVLVSGTAQSDTLKIDGATSRITINDVVYGLSPKSVSFDGGDGTNAVEVLGTSANDQLRFNAATGEMTLNKLTATFVPANLKRFSFDGLAGRNTAILIGTSGSDMVTLDSSSGLLVAGTLRANVSHTATISAYGGGGKDAAILYGSAASDVLKTSPNAATLADSSGTYAFTVNAFATIIASGRSGMDRASMYDSTDNDTFTADTTRSRMYAAGGTYSNQALAFELIYAYASSGSDTAWLYDSPRNESFIATPTGSTMTGQGFSYRVKAFDYVHASASEGTDSAVFYDSNRNDIFTASPTEGAMRGAGYFNRAKGFDSLTAYASSGYDTAYLYDSRGIDTLQADSYWVKLYSTSANYSILASSFDRVYACSTDATPQNIKDIDPNLANKLLYMLGAW